MPTLLQSETHRLGRLQSQARRDGFYSKLRRCPVEKFQPEMARYYAVAFDAKSVVYLPQSASKIASSEAL